MERWGYVTEDKTAPVISKYPNQLKIYHLASNVEEYMQEKGIIKGGGWKDTGYYLQNFVSQTYDSTNATSEDRAFRVAMEIIKYFFSFFGCALYMARVSRPATYLLRHFQCLSQNIN